LTRAVSELHDRLRAHDFTLERREFRPHVTLARLQQPACCDWSLAYHPIPAQECTTVAVFQSRLGAGGARYEVLHQTTL
jgi:2'-5' RNA ligase